jgi:hypothetical protein
LTVQASRYVEKPLVRLLECYVLWAIDALHPADELQLDELAPRLAELYDVQGNWHQIVAGVMELPANMRAIVQAYWERGTAVARESGEALDPQRFAESFVDAHLAF